MDTEDVWEGFLRGWILILVRLYSSSAISFTHSLSKAFRAIFFGGQDISTDGGRGRIADICGLGRVVMNGVTVAIGGTSGGDMEAGWDGKENEALRPLMIQHGYAKEGKGRLADTGVRTRDREGMG